MIDGSNASRCYLYSRRLERGVRVRGVRIHVGAAPFGRDLLEAGRRDLGWRMEHVVLVSERLFKYRCGRVRVGVCVGDASRSWLEKWMRPRVSGNLQGFASAPHRCTWACAHAITHTRTHTRACARARTRTLLGMSRLVKCLMDSRSPSSSIDEAAFWCCSSFEFRFPLMSPPVREKYPGRVIGWFRSVSLLLALSASH